MFASFRVKLIKTEIGPDTKILHTVALTEATVRTVELKVVRVSNT
jgi:hypothetical protein